MKIKLLVLISLIFSLSTFAQTPPAWEWAKRGSSNANDSGSEIKIDNAGNIYVTGLYTGPSFTLDSIFFISLIPTSL